MRVGGGHMVDGEERVREKGVRRSHPIKDCFGC